mmetsp:Transcript_7284/g.22815  ORF Transcript_7284/g.22815 Transcript_7284/m.22815 type:complete len:235 (+) Transcript_7284:113-817(+)
MISKQGMKWQAVSQSSSFMLCTSSSMSPGCSVCAASGGSRNIRRWRRLPLVRRSPPAALSTASASPSPKSNAKSSGVCPLLVWQLTPAVKREQARSKRQISTWSLPAARCNAVAPTLLLAFTPMKSSLLMSTWKASTCPSAAAKSSAFRCISSEKFTAAASACRTSRAASRLSRPSRASSNCCPSGLQCSGRAEGTGAGRALAALAPTCASRASGALALGSSSSSGRLPNSWAS